MDPRRRADEVLARASARGAFVVTPDNATSPMDSAATVRIPREAIARAIQNDPTGTVAVPQQHPQAPIGWPQHDSEPARQQFYGTAGQYPMQQPYPQQRPYPQS
jgi:hypothetical protein